MKKQLLTGAFILASFLTAQAQVLQFDNFDALTVGNVGTDLTGATAGQGGFYTSTVVGDNSDFQIVAGETGNGLQITGASVASGTTQETDNTKYLWKNGLDAAWAARTSGNEAISVDYSFYTGPRVAGTTNAHRVAIYNLTETSANVLGGYQYNPATGELRGLATYTNGTQAGLYTFTLSTTTGGAVLEANTWYTVAVTVVPSTGNIIWSSNDITVTSTNQDGETVTGPLNGGVVSSLNVGLAPVEIDLVTFAGTANTASTSIVYDNLRARAIATTDEILGTNPVAVASDLSVFPNPANNVINVTNGDALVNGVELVDLNGRTVKTVKFSGVTNAEINISDLASGVYMMNIATENGTTTKKIVKN